MTFHVIDGMSYSDKLLFLRIISRQGVKYSSISKITIDLSSLS